MGINKSIKTEILLESYETLKNDYVENRFQLKDIIVKMFEYDEEIGLRLWKQLIHDNIRHLKSTDNPSYFLCSYPFDEIKKLKGIDFCVRLIKEDEFIKECLFLNNGSYLYCINDICIYLAEHKEYKFLFEILLMIKNNKFCNENFFEKAMFSMLQVRGYGYNLQSQTANEYFSEEFIKFLSEISNKHLTGVAKARFDIELLHKIDEAERGNNVAR